MTDHGGRPMNGTPVRISEARPLFQYRFANGKTVLGVRAALLAEGEVAITRHILGGPWFITLTKTTASLPYEFPTAEAAEAAARQMDAVVSWDRYLEGAAGAPLPNAVADMNGIAALHGGKLTQRGRVSAADVRRQIARAETEAQGMKGAAPGDAQAPSDQGAPRPRRARKRAATSGRPRAGP